MQSPCPLSPNCYPQPPSAPRLSFFSHAILQPRLIENTDWNQHGNLKLCREALKELSWLRLGLGPHPFDPWLHSFSILISLCVCEQKQSWREMPVASDGRGLWRYSRKCVSFSKYPGLAEVHSFHWCSDSPLSRLPTQLPVCPAICAMVLSGEIWVCPPVHINLHFHMSWTIHLRGRGAGVPPHPRQHASRMAICPTWLTWMLQNTLGEEMALGVFLALHSTSFSISRSVRSNNNPFYYCAFLAKRKKMSSWPWELNASITSWCSPSPWSSNSTPAT